MNVTIRLDDDLVRQLRAIARLEKRSLSDELREGADDLVNKKLHSMPDIDDAAKQEKRRIEQEALDETQGLDELIGRAKSVQTRPARKR